jgi:hypothetical protein
MTSRLYITRHLRRAAPAIAIAAVAACAPFRRSADLPPAELVFRNESLTQADVFIVGQGLNARRIGTVMSGHTDTLIVPTDISARGGTVNIIARLLARSAAPRTGPVSINPGERYEVTLSVDARMLSFLPARS